MFKPQHSQSSGCTYIHQTSQKSLNICQKLDGNHLLGQEWSDGEIHATRDHNVRRAMCNTKKTAHGGMLVSSIVLLHDNVHPHTATSTRAFQLGIVWPPSLEPWFQWVTTTCLPTERTGCDHSSFSIMRWQKVSKHDCALTQVYKNLFPDTSASIPVVTTLRSSLSTYAFFLHIIKFFPIACFVNNSPEVTSQIAFV
jgi:hypothetical protein